MHSLSIKNQERVLKILIKLCSATTTGVLDTPENFQSHFSFISCSSLTDILEILENNKLIEVLYGDNFSSFNIIRLRITAKGKGYAAEKRAYAKELWLIHAKIPVIVSAVTTVIINYILPLLPQIAKYICELLSSPN